VERWPGRLPAIKKLIATCDSGLTGRRDRAMILISYAGALPVRDRQR
jgi:hypothetical protein